MIQTLLNWWYSWTRKNELEKYAVGKFYVPSKFLQAHISNDSKAHMEHRLPFEILEGKYKGVIFSFLTITLLPDRIPFDFVIHRAPEWVTKENFQSTARKVLLNILMTSIDNDKQHGTGLIKEDETGNNYTTESVDESRILNESASVHKD